MEKRLVLIVLIIAFVFVTSIFVISCSTIIEGNNETDVKDKEALYGKAVLELNQEKNITTSLDKRYSIINKKIESILAGEREMSLADFTRFKIEIDFLMSSGYNQTTVNVLIINFQKAFELSGEKVSEKNFTGSLGDRYYSINKSLDKYLGEDELSVANYLHFEQSVAELEEDGYPVPSKIEGLKNQLLSIVLAELESAIVNFEIPEEEFVEEIESEILKEVVEEIDEIDEIVEELEEVVELTGPKTVIVKLISGGFDASSMEQVDSEEFDNFVLKINVNDTVEFRNVREGNYKMALLVGNRECSNIKSGFFDSGKSFSWTFNESGICWISDAIFTTQAMKITIS